MSSKFVGLMRLHDGEEPKEIAADLGVSYATVIRWKGELTEAVTNGKINTLLAAEKEQLESLTAQTLADIPVGLQTEVETAQQELITGVTGLQRLDEELQTTARKINERIRMMTGTAESISDIEQLTDSLCSLQTAFFAKGTQINVQNNNGTGESGYSAFLQDTPGPKHN